MIEDDTFIRTHLFGRGEEDAQEAMETAGAMGSAGVVTVSLAPHAPPCYAQKRPCLPDVDEQTNRQTEGWMDGQIDAEMHG